MGCDIHGWVEKKVNEKWVAYLPLKDRNRNYERFGMLAGVRIVGPEAKGIPEDVSDTAKLHIEKDGSDGHSHSWLAIRDAYQIFKQTSDRENYNLYDAFGIDPDREAICRCCKQFLPSAEYRLVFWFDN